MGREHHQRLGDITVLRVTQGGHGAHEPVGSDATVFVPGERHAANIKLVQDILLADDQGAGRYQAVDLMPHVSTDRMGAGSSKVGEEMGERLAGHLITDFGDGHREGDVRGHEGHALLDELRAHEVIVEIQVDELAFRGQDAVEPTEVHAAVFFTAQGADTVAEGGGHGRGVVRTAMVDDKDLAGLGLGESGLDAATQHHRPVEGRDDDGDERGGHRPRIWRSLAVSATKEVGVPIEAGTIFRAFGACDWTKSAMRVPRPEPMLMIPAA